MNLADLQKEASLECPTCEGCGEVADTEEREPWTAWTSLPLQGSLAVLAGMVCPIPCPDCQGGSE